MQALAEVRGAFAKHKIDALLVSKPASVRYLSGFSAPEDGRVVVTPSDARLFTDSRYDVQAREESAIPVTVWKGRERISYVKRYLAARKVRALGVEPDALSLSTADQIRKTFGCRLKKTPGIVDEPRKVKHPGELANIRKAAEVNDQAFKHVLEVLKAGMSEIDLALELEWFLRRHAAFHVAFEIIVASGLNGAKPHARPSGRRLRNGELVTIDFGSVWNGYRSDITRTVALGRPSRKLRAIYQAVLDAQETGLEAIRPEEKAKKVDAAARRVIREAGYGRYFGHGLGHGVGLEIHEAPRLGQHSADVLKPGMVVTCEPGVYVPGLGGVRIEDLVLVTETGAERLSLATKGLLCL
jgi:Xaa-Pro aminopeptidase